MLTGVVILSLAGFGAVYPLTAWLVRGAPLHRNFHRFNLCLIALSASGAAYLLWAAGASQTLRFAAALWAAGGIALTVVAWNRRTAPVVPLSIVSGVGLVLWGWLVLDFAEGRAAALAPVLLGAAVLSMTVFSTSLGHWYLDESYIPLRYFYRAVYVLWGALACRFLLDATLLAASSVEYLGERVPLGAVLGRVEGIFLLIALLFGTVLPFAAMPLVKKTLDARSNTSATGLLYVMLIGVVMGELSCKYWLVRHGVVL